MLQRVVEVVRERLPLDAQPSSLSLAGGADLRRADPHALRTLRSRIVDDLADYDAWVAVMRALDPEADSIELPERFIVRVEPELAPEPVCTLDAADLRVQRIVDAFWEQYADRPAT